jgi:hypothetical protein
MTHDLRHPATERSDAARNRIRLLEAAARLVAERGPQCVTMEAIAQEAGVGKATLFRRFGDRNGLLLLLMDDAEAQFRQSCTAGPPPLGPGAPARGSRKHASTRPASTVARTPREDRSICASSHVLGFRDGASRSRWCGRKVAGDETSPRFHGGAPASRAGAAFGQGLAGPCLPTRPLARCAVIGPRRVPCRDSPPGRRELPYRPLAVPWL